MTTKLQVLMKVLNVEKDVDNLDQELLFCRFAAHFLRKAPDDMRRAAYRLMDDFTLIPNIVMNFRRTSFAFSLVQKARLSGDSEKLKWGKPLAALVRLEDANNNMEQRMIDFVNALPFRRISQSIELEDILEDALIELGDK